MPSGKVLVVSSFERDGDEGALSLATVYDDGRNVRSLFSGVPTARPKDHGLRLMGFSDNRRILLSDS